MSDNNQSWFDSNPRITLAVVIFSIIFLLVLVGEGLARYYFPQWAPMTAERAKFWEFDSSLGWRHIPNQVGEYSHPDFSVKVSINSQGLRDREYSLKRTNKKRMLVLGDSYGWGFGVNNNEIFTELMEKKHPDWEIINASVSGYGTVQEYLYYRDEGYKYQPDVILLLVYVNDFDDNIGVTDYWYAKPVVIKGENSFVIDESPLPPPSFKKKLDAYFLGNFYLIRVLYGLVHFPFQATSYFFSHEMVPLDQPRVSPIGAMQFILNKIIERVEGNGGKIVVVQTPLSQKSNQSVELVCHNNQIPCFHLNKVFKKGIKQAWRFEHDRHWNVLGHQLAADAIDQFLLEQNVW